MNSSNLLNVFAYIFLIVWLLIRTYRLVFHFSINTQTAKGWLFTGLGWVGIITYGLRWLHANT